MATASLLLLDIIEKMETQVTFAMLSIKKSGSGKRTQSVIWSYSSPWQRLIDTELLLSNLTLNTKGSTLLTHWQLLLSSLQHRQRRSRLGRWRSNLHQIQKQQWFVCSSDMELIPSFCVLEDSLRLGCFKPFMTSLAHLRGVLNTPAWAQGLCDYRQFL